MSKQEDRHDDETEDELIPPYTYTTFSESDRGRDGFFNVGILPEGRLGFYLKRSNGGKDIKTKKTG